MKLDTTKPVQTRGGLKAEIIRTGINDGAYSIAALITLDNGREQVLTFTDNGACNQLGLLKSFDLVNVPEKRTVKTWVNIYDDGSVYANLTKGTSDMISGVGRVACKEITIEFNVGEGL